MRKAKPIKVIVICAIALILIPTLTIPIKPAKALKLSIKPHSYLPSALRQYIVKELTMELVWTPDPTGDWRAESFDIKLDVDVGGQGFLISGEIDFEWNTRTRQVRNVYVRVYGARYWSFEPTISGIGKVGEFRLYLIIGDVTVQYIGGKYYVTISTMGVDLEGEGVASVSVRYLSCGWRGCTWKTKTVSSTIYTVDASLYLVRVRWQMGASSLQYRGLFRGSLYVKGVGTMSLNHECTSPTLSW